MTAPSTPDFAVPPNSVRLSVARAKSLADTIRVHHRTRRGGGYETAPVEILLDRFIHELDFLIRSNANALAARDEVNEKLTKWQSDQVAERGMPMRPSAGEVRALVNAQYKAESILDRAGRTIAAEAIPKEPDPTGDLATDVLARARWLSVARPASKQQVGDLKAAVVGAEQQDAVIRGEAERLAGVLPIAGAVLPGVPDATVEIPLPVTEAIEAEAS